MGPQFVHFDDVAAFSLVEGIRGKAVAREVYERVSVVGIAVVLLLFFIGLSNDIGRLGN